MAKCDGCPIEATFDSADALIDQHADIHDAPDSGRGAIELNRRALRAVQQRLECPGPATHDARIVCPVGYLAGDTATLAAGIPSLGMAIRPDRVVRAADKPIGQML
jgi:hypothetical protein